MGKNKNKKKEKKMEAEIQPQSDKLENTPVTEITPEVEATQEHVEETPVQVPVELIGDFLKKKREEKNLSIKVIAQHTKISTTQLELLESNDLEQLPDKAYVVGFVKSYSKTIGINQEESLDVLKQTYAEFNPAPVTFEAPEVQEARETEDKKSNIIKISGVALAVVAIIVTAIVSSSDDKETTTEKPQQEVKAQSITESSPIAAPQQKSEEVKVTETTTTDSTKKIEAAAPAIEKKVEAKPAQAVVVKKEEEKKPEQKKEEKKEKEVRFQPMPQPLYSFNSEMSAEKLNELMPENFQKAIIEGKQNVFINAVDGDTWITYKSDDNPIKKFVLKQGRTLLIRGDLNRVFLGNVNVTRIFLNNRPLTIKSRSGVKSLVFPQTKAEDFLIPLFIYKKNGKVMTSDEYIQEQNQ